MQLPSAHVALTSTLFTRKRFIDILWWLIRGKLSILIVSSWRISKLSQCPMEYTFSPPSESIASIRHSTKWTGLVI